MDQREQLLLLLLYGKHPHRNWEHPLPLSFSPFSLHQVGLPEGKHAQTAAAAAEANEWENTKSEKWSCQNEKKFNAGKATAAAAAVVVVFYLLAARGLRKAETFHVGWLVVVPLGMTLFQSNGKREGKGEKVWSLEERPKEALFVCFTYKNSLAWHLETVF